MLSVRVRLLSNIQKRHRNIQLREITINYRKNGSKKTIYDSNDRNLEYYTI